MLSDIILSSISYYCKLDGAKSVILFGSYTKGVYSDKSDIDRAIDQCADYFALLDDLSFNIQTLRKNDVLDLSQLRNESAKR